MIMICFSLPTASTMPHHQVSSLVTSERVLETESEFKYLRVDFDIYEFLTHYYRHNISMCSDIMSGQIEDRMNSKCICFFIYLYLVLILLCVAAAKTVRVFLE